MYARQSSRSSGSDGTKQQYMNAVMLSLVLCDVKERHRHGLSRRVDGIKLNFELGCGQ